MSERPRPSAARLALLALVVLPAAASHAQSAGTGRAAAKPAEQSLEPGNRGHGSFTFGYQNTLADGFDASVGADLDFGVVRLQSVFLTLEYYLGERWAFHFSVPYVTAKYRGDFPFCPEVEPPTCVAGADYTLTEPQPDSEFLDDGSYHGSWQDYTFGLSYHHVIEDTYFLTPTVLVTIPSHEYTFYAQAAPGKYLERVEFSLELAHQLELSNWYWRGAAGYVFVEETLGQNVDYAKVDLELGYFLSDRFIVKGFAAGKHGHGYSGADNTSEELYHIIQRTPHNYANLGAGLDWRIDDRYTVSATAQTLIWGEDVFDYKYSIDLRLTRSF